MFQVKGGRGQRYALKRMAVNNEQDLYIARQEIAITVSCTCPYMYMCTVNVHVTMMTAQRDGMCLVFSCLSVM